MEDEYKAPAGEVDDVRYFLEKSLKGIQEDQKKGLSDEEMYIRHKKKLNQTKNVITCFLVYHKRRKENLDTK